ncbi:MAG: M48 family metallopeptidase [Patescibacteria group bacterium]|nr:M48 family metallopeptidase [Patescibacteria group bacterium]
MANAYSYRDSNIRKTYLIFTIFLVFIIGLGFVFSQIYNNSLILAVAVIFSVISSFAGYYWSDKIALATSGAKLISKTDAPELYRVVENLAITAGLPTPRIYLVPELAPNAFATGRDPEHASIAVTAGLLKIMDKTELEGVIAHELSHVSNRDILVSSVVVVLVGMVSLLANWLLNTFFWGGFRDERGSDNSLALVVGLGLAIVSPIIATLIQLAISRKRELLADASGVLLTRYPDGLVSALEKIEQNPVPLRRANTATAHLWLSDPYKGRKKISWVQKLFSTHPPIEERVAALRKME